ncbi:hypothetical protein [Leptothoe spongobia]|uniref:DUF4159 domain-containing protein n=1 Tax=Leptothoe spongobia TAU-MAC 1115 TaxID=1967444 RepID=A0A947GKT6_9CYAN|nr:hypothetical protein [Leptothoe spongobia]MBT9314531.1 hypothetical protein [Leptothoe spongobia TAU-MAC 1115]
MPLQPLQRLHVNDGLLITANHWQIAHSYHQNRQTIHYQSLHQGGIVDGLGISVAEIPEAAPSRYRYPRWLTIQPGLAIDGQGNPIVVSRPENCYLSARPTEETTIYIVLKHSEQTSQAETEIVQDAFQIIEKDVPAEADEVELCRVQLSPGMNALSAPENVFAPGFDQLDLRHRRSVQSQSSLTCHVGLLAHSPMGAAQFESLFESLPGLYPSLQGAMVDSPLEGNLSHVSYDEFCQLDRSTHHQLAQYLQRGCVLLIDAAEDEVLNLYRAELELQQAMAAKPQRGGPSLREKAQEELQRIQACITDEIATLAAPIHTFLDTEGLSDPLGTNRTNGTNALTAEQRVHQGEFSLARAHPFRFSHLPTVQQRPIGLYRWGGVLLLIGPLLQAWGANDDLYLDREEIRSAQELGINLLTFAARHQQLHQWLMPVSHPPHPPSN